MRLLAYYLVSRACTGCLMDGGGGVRNWRRSLQKRRSLDPMAANWGANCWTRGNHSFTHVPVHGESILSVVHIHINRIQSIIWYSLVVNFQRQYPQTPYPAPAANMNRQIGAQQVTLYYPFTPDQSWVFYISSDCNPTWEVLSNKYVRTFSFKAQESRCSALTR